MMRKLTFVPVLLIMCGAFLYAQDRYEPNNSATRAYAISEIPARLTGLSLDGDDEDWFRFTVSRALTLSIGTESDIDTVIAVYGPNSASESFAENDDGGEDYNAKVMAQFEDPGIYYIKITSYGNESGSYTFFITPITVNLDPDEPNNEKSQAKSLDIASLPKTFSLISGRNGADNDWYILRFPSFQYRENEGLVIYTTGDCDTLMKLYLGDELIAENDDGGEDYNAKITFVPQRQRGGTNYYLLVRGYDEGTFGNYSLYAETVQVRFDRYEPNNTRSQATSISIGGLLEGNTLSDRDTEDWFTFTVARKGNFIIGTEGDTDTYIQLYSAGSDSSITDDDDSGEDYNALLIANLDPGTYFIKVARYGEGDDEEYSLFVRQ
jgi:hypothetical protein